MKEVISEPDVLILDAGSRFLIDEATSRTNCEDIDDIKCMEQTRKLIKKYHYINNVEIPDLEVDSDLNFNAFIPNCSGIQVQQHTHVGQKVQTGSFN